MAIIHGVAGKSVQAMGDSRYQRLIFRIVLPMIGILGLIWVGAVLISAGYFAGVAVLYGMVIISIKVLEDRGLSLKERIFHADIGAEAEMLVAAELNKLPDTYHVFHDLEFPGFNIDHVVLGPTGLFAVETKSHKGRVTQRDGVLLRNGSKFFKDFLGQSIGQVFALKDYLGQHGVHGQFITAILCFTRSFVQIRGEVRHVTVLNIKYLNDCIQSKQHVASQDVIDRLAPILSRATSTSTYNPEPAAAPRTAPLSCPKCGYTRSATDNLYCKDTECPQCGVIYAEATNPVTLSQKHSSKFANFLSNRAALRAGSLILAFALLFGLFFTLAKNVWQVLHKPAAQQMGLAPQTAQPQPPASKPTTPLRLGDRPTPFPLTHAVAATSSENSVPLVFVEDRGQNVILLFVDADSRQLVMRACVRANERLNTLLPRTDLGIMMVTGSNWHGPERHFGHGAEARKTVFPLKTQTTADTTGSLTVSASALFAKGKPSPPDECADWIQRAFGESGFMRMAAP
jgi:hypothetical protein